MAHAQKPNFVFRRNERVHLNRRGRQFSRLLAVEVCPSAFIVGSNADYCMFRGSEKSTDYLLHSPVSLSLHLPVVTVYHHISTGVYWKIRGKVCPTNSYTTQHWKYVNINYLRVSTTNRKHNFRCVRKIAKRDSFHRHVCLSVCSSVRMEQLGSHCTDFDEIGYFSIFRKSGQKIQVSLKSDKNNGYFTWRPVNFWIISRSILIRMRNITEKFV
jgi:hypothetical protein